MAARAVAALACVAVLVSSGHALRSAEAAAAEAPPVPSLWRDEQVLRFAVASPAGAGGAEGASWISAPGEASVFIFAEEQEPSALPPRAWAADLAGQEVNWTRVGILTLVASAPASATAKAAAPDAPSHGAPGASQVRGERVARWLRRLLAWLSGVVGATKWISASNALDQRTRLRVYDLVRTRPGLHAGQISDLVGLRRQTVLYHLRVLEEHRLITSRMNGRRRFYRNGDPGRDDAMHGLGETARRILGALVSGPASTKALAATLRISRRGVAWHLRRLVKADVVVPIVQGTTRLYGIRHGVARAERVASPDAPA